jgi:hypothetical protein
MITILATLALEHVNEPQVNGGNHGGGCKMLAKCCRIGFLSYISLVFPPVSTTCDLEAEFWVAEADMQLIPVPYNP